MGVRLWLNRVDRLLVEGLRCQVRQLAHVLCSLLSGARLDYIVWLVRFGNLLVRLLVNEHVLRKYKVLRQVPPIPAALLRVFQMRRTSGVLPTDTRLRRALVPSSGAGGRNFSTYRDLSLSAALSEWPLWRCLLILVDAFFGALDS